MKSTVPNSGIYDILEGLFPKRTLSSLYKKISAYNKVSLYTLNMNNIKSVEDEALFINSIERFFTKGSYLREDVDFDILYGDVVPGLNEITESIKDGKLVSRKCERSGPLYSKSKKLLILKRTRVIRNSIDVEEEISVYAILTKGGVDFVQEEKWDKYSTRCNE